MATAAVALEKLNKLKDTGITKYTSLSIDSAYTRQTSVAADSSSASGLPSVGHYIKKIFLVSDNDAYNRLYEFIGQQQLNNALHKKGDKEVRLLHRLSVGDGGERSRYTNPVTFFDDKGIVLYQQPLVYNPKVYPNKLKTTRIGNGYYSDGEFIKQPMDFSEKNYISLPSLQSILKSIVLPEGVAPQQRFNLTEEDYVFLYKYMSMLPRESQHPAYSAKEYPDNYAKFLMFGGRQERMPVNIRIFNKVGDAYGYMIDNAYVVDFDNKVEFLLSAVILANEKMIFNSDDYQYETIALPFMAKLGQAVYEHELKRRRKYKPKLNKFIIDNSKE